MPSQSVRGGIAKLLAVAVVITLSCNFLTGPSAAPPKSLDATKAALQVQGTALALRLTQTALSRQLSPPVVPAETLTPESPSALGETQATTTATAEPVVSLRPDAIEISYGQRLGSYPRKSEGVLYGFKGFKGDVVTIVLASSNARPSEPACGSFATSSTTFTLQTPGSQLAATNESAHLSSMRDYELPASGGYYIKVTCVGGGCNGHCTEADLSLEKK